VLFRRALTVHCKQAINKQYKWSWDDSFCPFWCSAVACHVCGNRVYFTGKSQIYPALITQTMFPAMYAAIMRITCKKYLGNPGVRITCKKYLGNPGVSALYALAFSAWNKHVARDNHLSHHLSIECTSWCKEVVPYRGRIYFDGLL